MKKVVKAQRSRKTTTSWLSANEQKRTEAVFELDAKEKVVLIVTVHEEWIIVSIVKHAAKESAPTLCASTKRTRVGGEEEEGSRSWRP